jgi:hypothetical protein
MAKKTTGLLALVAGVAAGAAAVFLSKKENRDMVATEVKKDVKKAKAVAKKVAAKVKKTKVVKKAKAAVKKVKPTKKKK